VAGRHGAAEAPGGRHGAALKPRVAARPTGNRANEAVVELVAREFNLKSAAVIVVSGIQPAEAGEARRGRGACRDVEEAGVESSRDGAEGAEVSSSVPSRS